MNPLFQRYSKLKYGSVYFWGIEIFNIFEVLQLMTVYFWGIATHHSVYLSFFSEVLQLMALYMCEVLQLMNLSPQVLQL